MRILLITLAVLLSSVASKANTVCIQDIPNPGDETCTTTYTTGTPTTTGNLISQDFIDGTWLGTMFPDSSDLSNESTFMTGKHGKYAETTISSTGLMTEAEIQQGFTSTFGVQARWWNPQASTFTMTQTAIDNLGNSTTQSTLFEDTTNHNYVFNPYANQLIVAPSENLTHGNITARFDFDIQGKKTYNGGHVGVDLRSPTLTIDYQTLSSTSTTVVEYCWQKTPTTCPGQDEIEAVEEIIENIEIPDDIFVYEVPETITYTPTEIEIDVIPVIVMDVELDIEVVAVVPTEVEIEVYDTDLSVPDDYVDLSVPDDVEMFEVAEVNTDDLVAMVTSEPEYIEEVIVEESIVVEEEPIDEQIEEQSSSEELVADEPVSEPETTEQEKVVEEPVETKVESKPEPTVEEDIVTEKPKVDIANIERIVKEQVTNKIQQIAATLDVVNEVLSREMTANQPDLSAYTALNNAMIDNRQLPGGNPAFFNQVALVGYDKTIYQNQISMATIDPVAQHEVKMDIARDKTNKAYFKLKALLEARQ